MSTYYEPPRPAPSRIWPWIAIVALFVLAALLAVPVGWWVLHRTGSVYDANFQQRAVTPRGDLAADEKATIDIYNQATGSVAYITTLTLRRDAMSLNVQEVPEGTGSGIVWDKEGHVVTNYHVVRNAEAAKVTLTLRGSDGHSRQLSYNARLVGVSRDHDVAVLYIDAPKDVLAPITIGSSSDLQVGQKTFAIGNPFGLDHSLTTGVVSALGRDIKGQSGSILEGMIQTDAAINPGNSGGPLLDSAGRLIGMNTAIYSPSGAYAGIGFAIPVDTINQLVTEIIRHGNVARPTLGVHWAQPQLTRRLGVDSGALIFDVLPDSAAAKAGLRSTRRDQDGEIQLGDIVLAVDGKPVQTAQDAQRQIGKHKVGDTLTLTIVRDDQRQDVQVTLQGT
jgi:S1-C subfamily serine protease